MVENCVGPSELHLKKELTALRKARFLRDPETCSSWQSPLSSKSFAVTSGLNIQNGTRGTSTRVNSASIFPEIPSRSDRRKKVYLYNWRYHSGKSSDSGIQLEDDDLKLSVEGSPEVSLSSRLKLYSKTGTNAKVPENIHFVRRTNLTAPVIKTSRKEKRSATSRQRDTKRSEASKLLDLPPSSLGDVESFEQSDATEYCNSEDLQHMTQGMSQRKGCFSRSASPMLSGSGCGNWSYSSRIMRSARRDESSHSNTPASTGSYYRYGGGDPSTVGSWDETAASGDDLDHLDLAGGRGCGVPHRSRRTKSRGCGSYYSPSLSDMLRRKGSSIICGGQKLNRKKRSTSSQKQNYLPKSSQGLPLLTNSSGGASSSDSASDELSTNIAELELEAQSRLDGKRWSSCKSQEGIELNRPRKADIEMPDQRSLSQKYRPRSFDDIIGQSIVVDSLRNAILKGRIAPAYLFHGPRGTGKTSTARVFSSALNCLSTEDKKPCGLCRECTHFYNGNGSHMREVDATDKKGLDSVRYLLKSISVPTTLSRYTVFVIDQCHMLSSKTWSVFLKFLEEPPPQVVFIFITIDPDNLSRAIVSRCQKYLFSKVKDVDIVNQLRKLSVEENLAVDLDALDLIALYSDGSLRDAETMLDQLSLLSKRITSTLVNDLVGVVSDEKLLDLLEIAMSSDTAETVRKSRELMDSGVDPMALMSQLAGLIMDIIAGMYRLTNSQSSSGALGGRNLTEAELERLQQALKILSDAEKQLRLSSERSTWFTAALLQLGTGHNTGRTQSSNSSSNSKHGAKKIKMDAISLEEVTSLCENECHPPLTFRAPNLSLVPRVDSKSSSPQCCMPSYKTRNENLTSDVLDGSGQSVRSLQDVTCTAGATGNSVFKCTSSDKLVEIWKKCIEGCHSKTLRQLLYTHGRLLSITEVEGVLIALLIFEDGDMKSRAERYLSSITDSIEIVLKRNVEVRIQLATENHTNGQNSEFGSHGGKIGVLGKEEKFKSISTSEFSDNDRKNGTSDLLRQDVDHSEPMQQGTLGRRENFIEEDKISALKTHVAGIDEQRFESAWHRSTEKNTSSAKNHAKLEKSQVLPQTGVYSQNHKGSLMASASKHWEDELSHEFKALKTRETQGYQKRETGGHADHLTISPSLLHSGFEKQNVRYKSSSGCNGLFCWNRSKTHGAKEMNVKTQRSSRHSFFGQCGNIPESR